jgi:undecaprenyl-diphosphatase
LGFFALACAIVVAVLSTLVAVRWGPLVRADIDLVRSAHDATAEHNWLENAAKQVTQLGDWMVLDLVAVAAAAAVATRRQWGLALLIVVVRTGELGIVQLMKWAIHRPRPTFPDPLTTAQYYSFPSGHAAGAAAMFGLLAVLVVRQSSGATRYVFWAVMAVVIAAVAASRVLLGVHYPADVSTGVVVGLGWLALCLYAIPSRGR